MVYERFVILCYERARTATDPVERTNWIKLGARFEELAMADALERLADIVTIAADGRVEPPWQRVAAE